MKYKMGIYRNKNEDSIQDFGEYNSVKEAISDWNKYDKPRGMHHAIIEKPDGMCFRLGRE